MYVLNNGSNDQSNINMHLELSGEHTNPPTIEMPTEENEINFNGNP